MDLVFGFDINKSIISFSPSVIHLLLHYNKQIRLSPGPSPSSGPLARKMPRSADKLTNDQETGRFVWALYIFEWKLILSTKKCKNK